MTRSHTELISDLERLVAELKSGRATLESMHVEADVRSRSFGGEITQMSYRLSLRYDRLDRQEER